MDLLTEFREFLAEHGFADQFSDGEIAAAIEQADIALAEADALPVPDQRQDNPYHCGVAALQSVLGYYGIGAEEADLARELNTTETGGTRPQAIIDAAQARGLAATGADWMTVADLVDEVNAGRPVMTPIQLHGSPEGEAASQSGHWVVVCGLGESTVVIQDPSAGKTSLPLSEFLARWHDADADGNFYPKYGITFDRTPAGLQAAEDASGVAIERKLDAQVADEGDVALAGRDGEKVESLLESSKQQGAKVLAEVMVSAVKRLVNSSRPLKAEKLFNADERLRLAEALAAVNGTANLLGRSRIRLRQQRAEKHYEAFCGGPGSGVPGPCPTGKAGDAGGGGPTKPAGGKTKAELVDKAKDLKAEKGNREHQPMPLHVEEVQRPYKIGRLRYRDEIINDSRLPVTEVDPANLTATQTFVVPDKMHSMKGDLRGDKPILIIRQNGKDYIEEGHHRALHALRTGQKVPARIAEPQPDGTLKVITPVEVKKHTERHWSFSDPTPWDVFDEATFKPLTPEEAIEAFRRLVPTLGKDPKRFGVDMRRQAFTLASATEKTLLTRVQDLIGDALATGAVSTGPQAVKSLLDAAGVTSRNPQYAEAVFRTNMMESYREGAQQELSEVADSFPVWRYAAIVDERSRPEHAAKNGQYYPSSAAFTTVRGTDADEVINCRCDFVAVYKRDWQRLKASGARIAAGYADPDLP